MRRLWSLPEQRRRGGIPHRRDAGVTHQFTAITILTEVTPLQRSLISQQRNRSSSQHRKCHANCGATESQMDRGCQNTTIIAYCTMCVRACVRVFCTLKTCMVKLFADSHTTNFNCACCFQARSDRNGATKWQFRRVAACLPVSPCDCLSACLSLIMPSLSFGCRERTLFLWIPWGRVNFTSVSSNCRHTSILSVSLASLSIPHLSFVIQLWLYDIC